MSKSRNLADLTPEVTKTANGVAFLDGSKVLTTGSALTFDGTNLTATNGASIQGLTVGRGAGAVASNTAVGASALAANTTGSLGTAVGYEALYNSTVDYNTAFGAQAGKGITTGTENIAVGRASMRNGAVTGTSNSGFGGFTLYSLTSGAYNTAIGFEALQANTTANGNSAIGYQAGYSTTTGSYNLFAGERSGYTNTTGERNVALGYTALNGNQTGVRNIAIGMSAMEANSSGNYNIGIGYQALVSNTTASNNTAVGYQAGYSNTTGNAIVAVGQGALYTNSTGIRNVAIGSQALEANTTADLNTAVGWRSMQSNTTGTENTASGYYSLLSNTTGSYNTAHGGGALQNNTTADYNTAVGYQAGYSAIGERNLFLGPFTGFQVTTGTNNTFVGGSTNCGYAMTTGSKNTILGGYNGNQGGLDIRTASNNVVLSDGDGNPRQIIDSNSQVKFQQVGTTSLRDAIKQSGFGYSPGSYGALVLGATSGSQTVSINYDPAVNATAGFSGNGGEVIFKRSATFITPNSANTAFYTQFSMTDGVTSGDFNDTSDVALKTNIKSIDAGLDTIIKLRPVTFDWKQEGKGSRSGFIAQEVETVLPNDVIGEDYIENNKETGEIGTAGKSINTTGIVAHLVKAVQELKAEFDAYKLTHP